MIELKNYLIDNDITQEAFAATIKISTQHLRSMLSGRFPLTYRTARKIEVATGGLFKAEDLLNIALCPCCNQPMPKP